MCAPEGAVVLGERSRGVAERWQVGCGAPGGRVAAGGAPPAPDAGHVGTPAELELQRRGADVSLVLLCSRVRVYAGTRVERAGWRSPGPPRPTRGTGGRRTGDSLHRHPWQEHSIRCVTSPSHHIIQKHHKMQRTLQQFLVIKGKYYC